MTPIQREKENEYEIESKIVVPKLIRKVFMSQFWCSCHINRFETCSVVKDNIINFVDVIPDITAAITSRKENPHVTEISDGTTIE